MSKERWQEEIRGQKRTITPHWITVQNKPGRTPHKRNVYPPQALLSKQK